MQKTNEELKKEMERVRDNFNRFKKRRAIQEKAENFKMFVVGLLFISVIGFSFMDEQDVEKIIWFWAGFMAGLLIICVVQDILVARKIKRLGLK